MRTKLASLTHVSTYNSLAPLAALDTHQPRCRATRTVSSVQRCDMVAVEFMCSIARVSSFCPINGVMHAQGGRHHQHDDARAWQVGIAATDFTQAAERLVVQSGSCKHVRGKFASGTVSGTESVGTHAQTNCMTNL
jgi:hypothetical protein